MVSIISLLSSHIGLQQDLPSLGESVPKFLLVQLETQLCLLIHELASPETSEAADNMENLSSCHL